MSSGVYVAVKYAKLSVRWLQDLQKELELKNPVPAEELHTTLVYSTKYADIKVNKSRVFMASPKNLVVWKTQDGKDAVILEINSEQLVKRHEQFMESYDINYGHDTYKPHITLSYDDKIDDLSKNFGNVTLFAIDEYKEDLKNDS